MSYDGAGPEQVRSAFGPPVETTESQAVQHSRAEMERMVEQAAGAWMASLTALDAASSAARLIGRDLLSNPRVLGAQERAARLAPELLVARQNEHAANVNYQAAQQAFVDRYEEAHR